jgi:hypothetical protein
VRLAAKVMQWSADMAAAGGEMAERRRRQRMRCQQCPQCPQRHCH